MPAVGPQEDKLSGRRRTVQHGEAPDRAKLGGSKHEPPIRIRKYKVGNKKPMRFVSLHHHTTFSYKDGYQMPEAHVRRATELNMGAFAVTEHGNLDSVVKMEIACEKAGVKPIYGCEIYMPTGSAAIGTYDEAGTWKTQQKHHLTILAVNQEGYLNLLKLVTNSWAEGFYYDPTVTFKSLVAHRRGLIILSGCQGSLLFCSTVGGKDIDRSDASLRRGLQVAKRFKKAFGDNYFIEVQAFPELEATCRFNPLAAKMARKLGIRLVGSMDAHYTELDDSEVQMILHNLRGGGKKTLEEQAREWGYDVPLCPPPNDMSIYRRLRQTGLSKSEAIIAIVSTEEIGQECTVKLPKLEMVRFKVPSGFRTAREYWEHALREGWRYRGFDRLSPPERRVAREQLAKERRLIESKDYVDYFLLVRDAVLFVKDELEAPVGWARGSAAASLASYLLRITEVNPLLFPLLVFERFIDETREDLPDIDLDFPSEVRAPLRSYLAGKHGEDCVNNIGTFTYFKSKLALDDTARVFRVPKYEVERVKDFLIERSSGDLRASSTIEDTADQFPQVKEVFDRHPELKKSELLEGNVKSFGVHAAGLVISNHPITEVCAVYEREIPKGSGNVVQVVNLDKYDAERQGLVKMDFLGLSTMSVLWSCCKYLGMSNEDLYNLPIDDPLVYEGFRSNDVVGVFQFDGRAMRYVCGSMKPDNFGEICDCNALARPGPLHNGAASAYAEIKHGTARPERFHPAVDRITAPCQYQIVYQEQILRIVREVGDFPWTHAAYIRKIISRKLGEQEFNKQWSRFWEGAQTVHERIPSVRYWDPYSEEWVEEGTPRMSKSEAKAVWGSLITSGSYAFNAAHCVAYGYMANATMYFKKHQPQVFYAASLAEADENPDKTRQLLRDAVKHDIKVSKPKATTSFVTWVPAPAKRPHTYKRVVRAGFKQIHGIGGKMAQQLVDFRELHRETTHGEKITWWDFLDIKGVGPKTVEKVEEWVQQKDPFEVERLNDDIKAAKKVIRKRELYDENGAPLPNPTHTAPDLPYEQGRSFAVVWLGTILQRNIRDIFEQNRAKTGEELDPSTVSDPHLNEWALLTCEDEHDQLLLKIDRWKYPRFKDAIFDFKMGKDLLLVEGVRPQYVTARQIKVKKLWVITT
jgi:DNA polymerase-3 subunit alpha